MRVPGATATTREKSRVVQVVLVVIHGDGALDVLEGTGLHVRMGGAGLNECERWLRIVAELRPSFSRSSSAHGWRL